MRPLGFVTGLTAEIAMHPVSVSLWREVQLQDSGSDSVLSQCSEKAICSILFPLSALLLLASHSGSRVAIDEPVISRERLRYLALRNPTSQDKPRPYQQRL